jgi:hypothetical protein
MTPEPSKIPFGEGMTPRQEKILDFGWEIMKYQNTAHIFLWLAADGWRGGNEITAWQHGPGQIAVKIKPWEVLGITPVGTSLN